MDSKEIIKRSGDISLTNVADGENQFCSVWPSAKQGLTLLQSIIKNPIAKGAIGVAIAAGDAVAKQICG